MIESLKLYTESVNILYTKRIQICKRKLYTLAKVLTIRRVHLCTFCVRFVHKMYTAWQKFFCLSFINRNQTKGVIKNLALKVVF